MENSINKKNVFDDLQRKIYVKDVTNLRQIFLCKTSFHNEDLFLIMLTIILIINFYYY